MSKEKPPKQIFKFDISLSVLNHLGRNLYRNFITVLGEAISNSWDANAKNVWIYIDKPNDRFYIKDDGDGMNAHDFQSKFLTVGYSKRRDKTLRANRKRPFIGAKGIGKLALLSCADRVSVFTKTSKTNYNGGIIDNAELDKAIQRNLTPDRYFLKNLKFSLISDISKNHNKGTILVFERTKENFLRNTPEHLRKLLALYFRFSLFDPNFTIHVNETRISLEDLQFLSSSTEFLWKINRYSDDYVDNLSSLKEKPISLTTSLEIRGFVASVKKPSDLKIRDADGERPTIDLFVNGRLREKNIIKHIPTQRIVESYIYGQIHFDSMDQGNENDPFTSSREGVLEDNENFQKLLNLIKEDFLPKILKQWDKFRREHNQDGDDENTDALSLKNRKVESLYNVMRKEFSPKKGSPEKKQVDKWLDDLKADANFNMRAYICCFLSENLVRRYIHAREIKLTGTARKEIKKYKNIEEGKKDAANISFQIRENADDLSYLRMKELAECAEDFEESGKKRSLRRDIATYELIRNIVGHTGLLTLDAKQNLNLIYKNIRSRIQALLKNIK